MGDTDGARPQSRGRPRHSRPAGPVRGLSGALHTRTVDMTKLRRLQLGVAAVALTMVGVGTAAPADATSYDLAGLWLFNESGGQTATDLSFHGNTGQLGSTP